MGLLRLGLPIELLNGSRRAALPAFWLSPILMGAANSSGGDAAATTAFQHRMDGDQMPILKDVNLAGGAWTSTILRRVALCTL